MLLFDEPVNGLDPEGIRWVRHFLRGLAAEGRTVFVSSHLISEMSLTADRLVVIGRGRLIAETSVADFVARSGRGAVKLVTPDRGGLHLGATAAGAQVGDGDGGSLTVEGLTAPEIGDLAHRDGLRVHELAPIAASLEDAFMELTQDEVEYRPSTMTSAAAAGREGVSTMSQAIQTAPLGHYRLKHVVRSEVAKIATLPSTAITSGPDRRRRPAGDRAGHQRRPAPRPGFYNGFDPTQKALTGLIVAGLTGGVFGALLITGEYSSGTIRATLAATPRRPLLLAAKIGVAAAAMVVFCELLSFVSFFLGQAILSGGGAPSASLGSPGALRAVLMTGLFIALLALMSFGFGLIFRSTAAAIAAFVGVVFVLPLVMRGISQPDLRYVPTNILTNSIMATVNQGRPEGLATALAGRRVVADGHLRRDRPGRRRRAVREARRLNQAGAEEGWVQIRIPPERAEQAKHLARRIATGAVPQAQLGGAGVLPRQLRPGLGGGVSPWRRWGSPDWRSPWCSSAS